MSRMESFWLVVHDGIVDVCHDEAAAHRFATFCGEGEVVEVVPITDALVDRLHSIALMEYYSEAGAREDVLDVLRNA